MLKTVHEFLQGSSTVQVLDDQYSCGMTLERPHRHDNFIDAGSSFTDRPEHGNEGPSFLHLAIGNVILFRSNMN
ncbi:MAG: hypothetical protein ACTSU9_11495 [Promethearchaeota archaeon]